MNYLAHLRLAHYSDDAMLGAFLGDFVKGSEILGFSQDTTREIRVHRHIDALTDAHPVVRAARDTFEPHLRRFSGIALDVFFDHVLARDWMRYQPSMSLSDITTQFYQAMKHTQAPIPERARLVANRMAEQDWLSAYADLQSLPVALRGIGRRLPRGAEQLDACAQHLVENHHTLAQGFPSLFSDLQDAAERYRKTLSSP